MTHEEKGIQILLSAARLRAPQFEEMLRLNIQAGHLQAEAALLERMTDTTPGADWFAMRHWIRKEVARIDREVKVVHGKMLALTPPIATG